MTAAPIIRVRDLKVAFGSSVVLEHLNLDIPQGEVVGGSGGP